MRRRALLRRAAAGGLLLSAGCAEREEPREETATVAEHQTPVSDRVPDLPVKERSEELATVIEDAAAATVDSQESFEAALDEFGVEVEHLGPESDAVLALEYAASPEGVLDDIGRVAGAYAAYVEGGDPEPELAATMLDAAGASFGTFHVYVDWAAAYNAGERSAAEYGEMVVGTLETEGKVDH